LTYSLYILYTHKSELVSVGSEITDQQRYQVRKLF